MKTSLLIRISAFLVLTTAMLSFLSMTGKPNTKPHIKGEKNTSVKIVVTKSTDNSTYFLCTNGPMR